MESCSSTPEDEDPAVWVCGERVEIPVLMGDTVRLIDDMYFLLYGRKADPISIISKRSSPTCLNHQLNTITDVVDGVFHMPGDTPTARHMHDNATVIRLMALVVVPGLSAADVLCVLYGRIDAALISRPLLPVDAPPRSEADRLAHNVSTVLIA